MRLREQVKPYFLALHLTLGLVILFESARELLHAVTRAGHGHLAMVAAVEGVAAILFLWPRTMRLGGLALTAVLAGALIVHAVRGEFQAPLLVYAVATLFVTVNGNAWPARAGEL
ncbi:MAG TPA: hypothetical protein VFD76_04250 [Gemmatimonadales bacterium]|nr:hypothetical protein [Gemmatimonadales bacterium]